MFDHIGIFVSDTARSFAFFEKALAPLGVVVRERQRKWGSIVMSSEEWPPFLWIGPAGGTYYGTEVRVSTPYASGIQRPFQTGSGRFLSHRPGEWGKGQWCA